MAKAARKATIIRFTVEGETSSGHRQTCRSDEIQSVDKARERLTRLEEVLAAARSPHSLPGFESELPGWTEKLEELTTIEVCKALEDLETALHLK